MLTSRLDCAVVILVSLLVLLLAISLFLVNATGGLESAMLATYA